MAAARFAVVPAAGRGSRLGEAVPKQYLSIGGAPMLYHALAVLAGCAAIARVYVVLAADDRWFGGFDWSPLGGKISPLYCGGASRAATVFNGLAAARYDFEPADWALVHDAARPCLDPASLERLFATVGDDEVGGLLAVPVSDTLKRDDGGGRVASTPARAHLWRAQTPQMFRYALLLEAMHRAASDEITDEAAAIEKLGLAPRLVRGSAANIKVTYSEDVAMAQAILRSRGCTVPQ